jgi:hypothetical protein
MRVRDSDSVGGWIDDALRRCQGDDVKRADADRAMETLLQRFFDARDSRPVSLITQLALFGSYARGALNPHDVDLHLTYEVDHERAIEVVQALSRGIDPDAPLRVALRGRTRSIQIVCDQLPEEMLANAVVLWRSGDSHEQALSRLKAIAPDPSAGRAPRDAMIDAFAGLDHILPMAFRRPIADAVEAGALRVEQLVLDDGQVRDPVSRKHIDQRWSPTSPLYRAAHAILAFHEAQGISPRAVHLHGLDVHDPETPYYAGMQLRYTRAIRHCLGDLAGTQWIEVVRPSRMKPLMALKITPGDRSALARLRWT